MIPWMFGQNNFDGFFCLADTQAADAPSAEAAPAEATPAAEETSS